MHQALILVARAIALAHEHWRRSIGRRLSLSGQLAVLEERISRLEAENTLLRARLLRVPARRRPRYRAHERLEILWHAARYRLSVTATAHLFAVTRQTVIHWRRALHAKRSHQGLRQRTPDEVYRGRPPRTARNVTSGTLCLRFLDGDRQLPILRLASAA